MSRLARKLTDALLSRTFWASRLALAVCQVPIFAWLTLYGSERDILLYLGWVSIATLIYDELPAGGKDE